MKECGKTNQIQWKKHVPFLGVLLLLFSAGPFAARQPWFDEVLAMDWLAYPFLEVPGKYVIPNNHIFYTLCLYVWKEIANLFQAGGIFYLRVLSLLTGCAAVYLISRRVNRSGGLFGGLPVLILFIGSGPVILFSTALRGYILSLLCTFAAFLYAEKWMKHPRKISFILYFVFCFFALWTIPTNIFSIGAGLLYLAPKIFRSRREIWKLLFLGLMSLAAFCCAYLPIFKKFLKVASLREGWFSYPAFLQNYYGTYLLIYFPLLIFFLFGFFVFLRKRNARIPMLCSAAVLLLPLILSHLFQVPPFPRVFFPMSGVIALICSDFLTGYIRSVSGFRKKLPLLLSVVWLLVLPHLSPVFSEQVFGGLHKDDLLYPYPLSVTFVPHKIANRIVQAYSFENLEHVFLDFDADPPSIQFQLYQQNMPEDLIVKDRPDLGRVVWLDPRDWIVCRDEAALEKIRNRFHLEGEYRLLKETRDTYQKIYVPSVFFP